MHSACEGFGITLRLMSPTTSILVELKDFLTGEAFNAALARKFGLSLRDTTPDNGIQKYLDGYEISPHPDTRKKALTYMVNINPHSDAEELEHHTHYLKLKPEFQYVKSFWEGNPDIERCWIPWDWCETASLQTKNNSIVIFAPGNDTLHGVKASYNHLAGQRTQLYGNLCFNKEQTLKKIEWEDLDLKSVRSKDGKRKSVKAVIGMMLPTPVIESLGKMLRTDRSNVIRDRLKQ